MAIAMIMLMMDQMERHEPQQNALQHSSAEAGIAHSSFFLPILVFFPTAEF
jgi:hypothetical protein